MNLPKPPPTLTREANELRKKGDYAGAIKIYEQLSSILGIDAYRANISYCQKRIKQQKNSNIRYKFKPFRLPGSDLTSNTLLSSLDSIGTTPFVPLTTDVTLESDIKDNQSLNLIIQCISDLEENPKAAICLISFLNKDHVRLLPPYQGIPISKHYGPYKYIASTLPSSNTTQCVYIPIHSAANKLQLTIRSFNASNDLRVRARIASSNLTDTSQESALSSIVAVAKNIPDSNGSRYYKKIKLKVAVIADIYMFNFYKDAFEDCTYITPDNFPQVLSRGIHAIIYTTCWKGINDEEWRGLKFREKPKNALNKILNHAHSNSIPSIFQSIEDPSNFEYFLPIAKLFDYVFTTDFDCIERYKEALGHNNVFYGEYGANPQQNNPIGCRRNIYNAVFFAGSYPERYKERCEDMQIAFDSIIQSGGSLAIADRNYDSTADDICYPKKYKDYLYPPIQHSTLQKVHKLFRYSLNFNSIKNSPTMCAMRVYELQAQGIGIISNYAKSVYNKFPLMRILANEQNLSFELLDEESPEEYEIKVLALRNILATNTSYQIISKMLRNATFKIPDQDTSAVCIICKARTKEVLNSYSTQSYNNCILIEESELHGWSEFCLQNKIRFFGWFSQYKLYGSGYIQDLINGFKYTDSSFICKSKTMADTGMVDSCQEFEYTYYSTGKDLSLFSTEEYTPMQIIALEASSGLPKLSSGFKIDHLEYKEIGVLQPKCFSTRGRSYRLSVIVPVYNNGLFLKGKCLSSLKRNSCWEDIEVVLVDDGSSDPDTCEIIKDLDSRYQNITLLVNHDGCSGSASRPRNQGISIAQADLVSFLDPDNEISPGGYDNLLDIYQHSLLESDKKNVDFVSGFHLKVSEKSIAIGKHTGQRISYVYNTKDSYLKNGRFPVVATQPAVLRKKFLLENQIRFVEGSAGQDTLFGWELLAYANLGVFTSCAHIVYYSERSDSITNKIDRNYFRKKLFLEIAQLHFLHKHGLFDVYLNHRWPQMLDSWYLPKLRSVPPSEREVCEEILHTICMLYVPSFKIEELKK